MGTTPRLGLRYPILSDGADVPRDIKNLADDLDSMVPADHGPIGSRPTSTSGSPGIPDRLFRETPSNIVWLDTGTGWIAINQAAAVDAAPNVGSLRTLGPGGAQAAPGNDARLSDQRTPLDGSVTGPKVAASLKPSGGAAAATEALRAVGTGTGQVAAGLHAAQHAAGGADPITVAKSQLVQAVQDAVFAAGDVKFTEAAVSAGAEPSGWLVPDGREVSRSAFSALYAALGGGGSPHGQGDGSTTFNLPDHRGRSLVVKGPHATVSAVGQNESVAAAGRSPLHGHFIDHTHNFSHYHNASALFLNSSGIIMDAGVTNTSYAWAPNTTQLDHHHYTSFNVNTGGPDHAQTDAMYGGGPYGNTYSQFVAAPYSVVNALVKT